MEKQAHSVGGSVVSSHWAEAAKISREFSAGGAGFFDFLFEHGEAVAQYYDEIGVDRRALATGDDYHLWQYDSYVNPNPEWEAMVWQGYSSIASFLTLHNTGTHPKILTDNALPAPLLMERMTNGTADYTFTNNWSLKHLEQFALTHPDVVSAYPDVRYSVLDEQDLLDGEASGGYDAVQVFPSAFFRPSMNLLDAYMDAVKPGGFLLWMEASKFSSMYTHGYAELHMNYYTRFNRHIAESADFESYHFPLDKGFVIAKRLG